ncbi:MAG: hypothetical protein CBD90_01230 [Chloroflexi bacterium TMED230]|nr:MAG: hypothetical protein CBD90_01230 [Chloroflexi bacterium TMED230]
MKNRKKVIIIGGGLGGLATAINLSKSEFEITIIEKNSNLGGKMNIFKKDGFTFDTGPSLITLPHIFENLFQEVDENIYDHLKFIKLNPLFLYMFEKEKIRYSSNLNDLEKIFNYHNNEIDKFYELISKGSKLFQLSEKTFFKKGLFSKPNISDLLHLMNTPFQLFFKNYSQIIEKSFSDEKVRKILNRYPTYVGSSPYKSSGILSVIPYMELSYGAWYISGGLYKLIEKIEKIIVSKNINIIKDTKVSRINHVNKEVQSVTLSNGENLECDIIVSNVDPLVTKTMINKNLKIKEKSLSMSGLVLLVGLDEKVPEILHHNVIFSKNYKKEFHEIFNDKKFPSDPTVYINCPSKSDKSLAPSGSESVFLMCNAPATSENWGEEEIKDAISKIRTTLKKHKLEKIIDNSKFLEIITPNDFEKKFAAPYGSIYGKVSHGVLGSIIRHPNKDKKIKGLYYVGGGVHPGGGTPIVVMSSKIVSNEIINKYTKK